MQLSSLRKIFDFIRSYYQKEINNTPPVPSLWRYFFQKLIDSMPAIGAITIFAILLLGLIPVLNETKEQLPISVRTWAAITVVVLFFYLLLKSLKLAQRSTEIEEQKKAAQHIRDIQWEEIKKSQKRDNIESGLRIASACTELLNSPKFDRASKAEARLMLVQIFRDEEVVDEFIKFSALSKFTTDSLGQAKDDSVVLSAGEDLITVQDIRRIEAAIGNRFSFSLSALKIWSQTYKSGINTLDHPLKSKARSDLINIVEAKFKGEAKLSNNFKESFERVFIARL